MNLMNLIPGFPGLRFRRLKRPYEEDELEPGRLMMKMASSRQEEEEAGQTSRFHFLGVDVSVCPR